MGCKTCNLQTDDHKRLVCIIISPYQADLCKPDALTGAGPEPETKKLSGPGHVIGSFRERAIQHSSSVHQGPVHINPDEFENALNVLRPH